MTGSILDEIAGLDLGLRDTVILVQAGIEYHVNQIMLKRFGTDSFESERMNSKVMALNDNGIIDDILRQDLIQIARIRHLFAHRLDVEEDELMRLVREIRGRKGQGTDLRSRFLEAVGPSYDAIRQRDEEMT